MERRRRPDLVDLVTLPLDKRYLLLAATAVLTGSVDLRRTFHRPPGTREDAPAALARDPLDADRARD